MEPTAKVVIETSKGEIFVELFAKEAETFCRPFLQNCLDNKYNGISFNKVLPNLVQTEGNGQGSKIKRSYHSRLKFDAKGCVGLVNSEDSKSASVDGFFITTTAAPELNNHYVLIGRVVGDSLYNVIKMSQNDLQDDGETPVHPVVIKDTRVTETYFSDLKPTKQEDEVAEPKKKKRKPVKLDYDEDNGDEEDTGFRMRSAHDTLDDKKLKRKSEEKKEEKKESEGEDTKEEDKPESKEPEKETNGNGAKAKSEDQKPDEEASPDASKTKHDIVSIELANKQKEAKISEPKPERDLDLDPPYDSDLDLAKDEIEYEQLCKHKFVC